jgi:phosphoribosylglycinamide formyltransferase 2
LHARAILGLPIPVIRQRGPAASCALLVDGDSANVRFENVERALIEPDTAVRLFGKPEVRGHRRMGVSLALGKNIDDARAKARAMTQALLEGVRLD